MVDTWNRRQVEQLRIRLQNDIVDQGQLLCLGPSATHSTITLPSSDDAIMSINTQIIDWESLETSTKEKLINWCRHVQVLYPLLNDATNPAENLLTAVTYYIWGLKDAEISSLLRRMVYVAMTNQSSGACRQLYMRWQLSVEIDFRTSGALWRTQLNELRGITGFDEQWRTVCNIFADASTRAPSSFDVGKPSSPLHPIHIFTISNILRRPIFILPGYHTAPTQVVDFPPEQDISGIYLPVLHDPSSCCRSPVTLLVVRTQKLLPLVPRALPNGAGGGDGGGVIPELAVPLVGSDLVPLVVRCLTDAERPEELLPKYIRVCELPYTTKSGINFVSAARFEVAPPTTDAEMVARGDASQNHDGLLPQQQLLLNPAAGFLPPLETVSAADIDTRLQPCQSPGCQFFGRKETNWKCSACHRRELHAQQAVNVGHPLRTPADMAVGRTIDQVPIPEVFSPSSAAILCSVPNCRRPVADACQTRCWEHAVRTPAVVVAHGTLVPESHPVPAAVAGVVPSNVGSAQWSRQETGAAVPHPCRAEGCDLYGATERGGFCSQHYRVFVTQQASQVQMSTKCRNQRCDGDADASFGGVCRRCFVTAGISSPLCPPVSPGSTAAWTTPFGMMQESRPAVSVVSNSSSSHATKCVFCANPGRSEYNGLCQQCYAVLRQNRPLITHENDLAIAPEPGGVSFVQAPPVIAEARRPSASSLPQRRCVMEGCRLPAVGDEIFCTQCKTKQEEALIELNIRQRAAFQ